MVGGIVDGLFGTFAKRSTQSRNGTKRHSSSSKRNVSKVDGGSSMPLKPPVLKQVQQVRKWLEITPDGKACSMELSKVKVTQQLGIPLRDLRILDPMLATSYPSALLAREKSIIVNMEFIKMIIGMERCYVTNLDDPNAADFVDHLQNRLRYGPTLSSPDSASNQYVAKEEKKKLERKFVSQGQMGRASMATTSGASRLPPPNPLPELPFELRVLETALDYISKYLEQQVTDVEAAGHPALDALTQTISTSNLERVRRIKNRMVRLNTRIETLKEVLEKTLDDDADMKDFNLSALEEERQEYLNRQALKATTPFDIPSTLSGSLNMHSLGGTPQGGALTSKSMASSGSSETSLDDDEDVEVVEQLLESYFMRLDNTWNRLQTLTEYVDDTEDFINIELDSHRNQLIRLDIVLTCFTACMGLITAVTALFAMNVDLQPGKDTVPYRWFVIIAVTASVGAVALFSAVMAYCKIKRLL